jgi:hypothetical protein
VLRAPHGLLAQVYDDLDEAKKDAGGYLLGRGKEKKVEVLTLAPGSIGGLGPVVATVSRKRSHGPLTWTEGT